MRSIGPILSIAAIVFNLVATPSRLFADTACNAIVTGDPTVFFCDDFDRYCTSPPADPTMPCTGGANNTPLRAQWVPMDHGGLNQCPGTDLTVETDTTRLVSNPFGGRYPCQVNAHLGQTEVDLRSRIQAKFGAQYSAVLGTDAAPLELSFEMNGGNCNNAANCNFHIMYDTGYMELGLDDQPGAQMDYIKVGANDGNGCIDCFHLCPGPHFSVHNPWPTVCQSYTARSDSPHCPTPMASYRSALAVGANKLLDPNPCHCEITNEQKPINSHLSYYDGWKWRILTSGLPKCSGDFVMGSKFNYVTMLIKTNTVDISLFTKIEGTDPNCPGVNVTSTITGLPRYYTGSFNRLRAGTGHGCELNNGSYTCSGNDTCFRVGEFRCDQPGTFAIDNSANIIFDNVFMKGGGANSQNGACCLPNATCQETTQANCTSMGGKFGGVLSTCANTVCCHVPFADADGDSDVDMIDFSTFQGCYTGTTSGVNGTCKCFDKASPTGKIDGDDFDAFKNCVSGPGSNGIGPSANVPWLQANTPNCSKCPPPPALAPGCP